MRVTNSMMNTQLLSNLRNNYTQMNRSTELLATGQKIQKPSDDPVGVGYLMRYNTELGRNEEFLENAKTGTGMLSTMDSLMQQASDVLKRAQVLVQSAATGTTSEEGRSAVVAEMEQLLEQLITIGNSQYNGKFLFNGQKTDQAPYTSDGAATDETDQGVYYLNVSPSVTVPVSITGEKIFGEAGSEDNVFHVLSQVIDHLNDGNTEELQADIGRIEQSADRLGVQWSEIGARMNRFELVVNRIGDEQAGLKSLRAELNDVDFAEAIIQLKLQESVYQAALSTGARMLQTSLVDFIR